ncbi:MAG: hypothetical protein Q7S76_00685 [bacterium]|nr:hypothetical protein [bacterium]
MARFRAGGGLEIGGWRGDHTFSSSAALFGFEEFILPEVAKDHRDWSPVEVRREALRRFNLRLSENLGMYFREQKSTDGMSTRWNIEEVDGVRQFVVAEGEYEGSTLNGLWENTRLFAVVAGSSSAYDQNEHRAQLALQDAFIENGSLGAVLIISHPDDVKYMQVWEKNSDGTLSSYNLDMMTIAGRHLTHAEGDQIIGNFVQRYQVEDATDRSAFFNHNILITERPIDSRDVYVAVQAKVLAAGNLADATGMSREAQNEKIQPVSRTRFIAEPLEQQPTTRSLEPMGHRDRRTPIHDTADVVYQTLTNSVVHTGQTIESLTFYLRSKKRHVSKHQADVEPKKSLLVRARETVGSFIRRIIKHPATGDRRADVPRGVPALSMETFSQRVKLNTQNARERIERAAQSMKEAIVQKSIEAIKQTVSMVIKRIVTPAQERTRSTIRRFHEWGKSIVQRMRENSLASRLLMRFIKREKTQAGLKLVEHRLKTGKIVEKLPIRAIRSLAETKASLVRIISRVLFRRPVIGVVRTFSERLGVSGKTSKEKPGRGRYRLFVRLARVRRFIGKFFEGSRRLSNLEKNRLRVILGERSPDVPRGEDKNVMNVRRVEKVESSMYGFAVAFTIWRFLQRTRSERTYVRAPRSGQRSRNISEIARLDSYDHPFRPWILASIIWYLAMIREQGMPRVHSSNKKKTASSGAHGSSLLPIMLQPRGVIFSYHS